MGTHNATQPISFEHSIFQVRCSCLSPRMVQDGPGCPCCCQDVSGHARMHQDVPGPPRRFPRYPRVRTVQVPLELYPATQGSGGGLEALPAAQETVGETPEPCTSERVKNGFYPLNCVGLKITENHYLDYVGAFCTFILFSM